MGGNLIDLQDLTFFFLVKSFAISSYFVFSNHKFFKHSFEKILNLKSNYLVESHIIRNASI